MRSNADKIQAWRDEHPTERLNATTLSGIIGEDLHHADLRDADLRFVDLRGADLGFADLRRANLRGADLIGADLWGADMRLADMRLANLRFADLRRADLYGANLYGAHIWGGFRLDGLPSGQVTMVPTCGGWRLVVGCWGGTIDELEALAQGDDNWPEAKGRERELRRPVLLALIPILRAHAEYHHDRLVEVRERWGGETSE